MTTSIVVGALALIGGVFSCLAGLGIVRMPDTITRMHAATKVSAFGSGMTLLAAAIHFGDPAIAARCVVAIALILLSTPIAAHLLARAARHSGAPQWERTTHDEYPTPEDDDAPRPR